MTFDAPKLITLTLAGTNADLSATLARLASSMKALRKTRLWAERVKGGLWSIEVTRGRTGRHWHVHAHVLADAEYIPQRELSAEWQRITGDSYIVDIRSCTSRGKAAAYVAKYATKPAAVARWSADLICEFATAMKGKRLLQTFGGAHGVTLDPADPNENDNDGTAASADSEEAERVAIPLEFIHTKAWQGDVPATVLIKALIMLGHKAGSLLVEDGPPPLLAHVDLLADPLEVLFAAAASLGMNTPHPDVHREPKPPRKGNADNQLQLWKVHAETYGQALQHHR